MTVLAVFSFVVAAYAAATAVVALVGRRVLLDKGRPVSNVALYGISAAAVAAAMVLDGFGVLDENSYVGLIGSVFLLAGLAGSFRART